MCDITLTDERELIASMLHFITDALVVPFTDTAPVEVLAVLIRRIERVSVFVSSIISSTNLL